MLTSAMALEMVNGTYKARKTFKVWQRGSMWCVKDDMGRMALGKTESEALDGLISLIDASIQKWEREHPKLYKKKTKSLLQWICQRIKNIL